MKNLCAILNIAPLYRKAIYERMDQDLHPDFYFGDFSNENIALLNPAGLSGFRRHLSNVYRGGKLVWQKGALKAAFGNGGYRNCLLTGNPGIRSNWIIALTARLLGRKVWLWTHGLRGNESPRSRLVNILYMRLASGMLFYSERGAQLAREAGIPERKIHVVHNSLDYGNQKKLRERVGDVSFIRNYFGNSDPYLIFVGRLTAVKKVDLLIKAMQGLQFNTIIVGDGPEREGLEKMVQESDMLDRVWFYGECYDEQMLAQLIYHAQLLVSPGNIGLSAIHAMGYGTAAVTHGNLDDQMPEVEAVSDLSEKLGRRLLFSADDPDDLADVVSELIPFVTSKREDVRKVCFGIIESKWNAGHQISVMKETFGI